MRKILVSILTIVLIMAIALSGYIVLFHKQDADIEEENQEPEPVEEVIDYGYLKPGEWGIASKYSSKTERYEDVNVAIKQVVRGNDAEKIIKEYTRNNKYFVYEEPKDGMEWLVVEYVINFGNYTKGNNGANSDIQTKIKGYGEDENIIIGNKTYETVTQDISQREYTKEEQTIGKFATQIPIECEKYVIMFGNPEYHCCEFEMIEEKEDDLQENETLENQSNEQ